MKVAVGWILAVLWTCSIAFAQDISGPLSGTLGPGTFHVVNNISVPVGDSLVVQPGTTLLFDGGFAFAIYGYLHAAGTEQDSIQFLKTYFYIPWKGLIFYSFASDSSIVEYCFISGSDCQGMEINAACPTIRHCTFNTNIAGIG
jgi:hypothetical protein